MHLFQIFMKFSGPAAGLKSIFTQSRGRRQGPIGFLGLLACLAVAAESLLGGALEVQYRNQGTELVLDSQDARQQLLATWNGTRDVTREVSWVTEPSGIVRLDGSGRVIPVADGAAVITAKTQSDCSHFHQEWLQRRWLPWQGGGSERFSSVLARFRAGRGFRASRPRGTRASGISG
ncbi:MAG: hypothetical protein RIS24_893 [Verrucomicrobiota bacterium]